MHQPVLFLRNVICPTKSIALYCSVSQFCARTVSKVCERFISFIYTVDDLELPKSYTFKKNFVTFQWKFYIGPEAFLVFNVLDFKSWIWDFYFVIPYIDVV